MAYKNQKKNKLHHKEVSKKLRSRKCAREKERWVLAHPTRQMSMNEMESIISRI